MYIKSTGFAFDCRRDCKKDLGIVESYDVKYKNGIQIVKLTTAVNAYGMIVKPSYSDINMGFTPIKALTQNETFEEDVNKFIRSHKLIFSKLTDTTLIVTATLQYDMATGRLLIDKCKVVFYAPKTTSDSIPEVTSNGGKQEPAVICDRVDVVNGVNTMVITKDILYGYKSSFLSQLTVENTKDKYKYIQARVL